MSTLNVKVAEIEQVTSNIKHFTLVGEDGRKLPAFSGGSHVVVAMDINGRIHRNPYSLMGSTEETSAYHISVLRQEKSRGGSVYMHDNVTVGSTLKINYPLNLFALDKLAHKHLLVAGGIGITPFMSQIEDLKRNGAMYELHYSFRTSQSGAFVSVLKNKCAENAKFYITGEGLMLDFSQLLSQQPLGTHVYVCGPHAMVVALIEAARGLGWPDRHVHSEQFSVPPTGEAFKLKLVKSAIEITVPSELSMLEAMEAAGIDAPYLCRGGACGRCEMEVLRTDGTLIHNDHYLTEAEKVAGKKILPCISRAKCDLLELNF